MIAFPDRKVPDLLTEAEAIQYLRLDTIGVQRPSLTVKRYRRCRGNYVLKTVRISGRTPYRVSDLQAFVAALQEKQDLSKPLTTTRGQKRRGIL